MADPGEGPGGTSPPLIFRPNWGPKGQKKLYLKTASHFSKGLDDRLPLPPPAPLSEGPDPALLLSQILNKRAQVFIRGSAVKQQHQQKQENVYFK